MTLKLAPFYARARPVDVIFVQHKTATGMEQKIAAPKTKVNNQAAVRKVIDDFMAALCQKDIRRMMLHYAPDAVLYDVKPPFQVRGAVAWRHIWEACLPFFPIAFEVEIKDTVIHAGNDVALSHYIFRLIDTDKDHAAAQTWVRVTTGFKKIQGRWKIVHEHGSVPFNPHTLQAQFTLEP
jgi:uncharacterized protein (TIGR02246 family)